MLVAALLWLRMLQQGRNMLASEAPGSPCRSWAACPSAPSLPGRHQLSCLAAKMILVTDKSDVRPMPRELLMLPPLSGISVPGIAGPP